MYVSIYKLISHRQSTSLSFKIDHMLRGITQSQLYKSDESFREKKQSLRVTFPCEFTRFCLPRAFPQPRLENERP